MRFDPTDLEQALHAEVAYLRARAQRCCDAESAAPVDPELAARVKKARTVGRQRDDDGRVPPLMQLAQRFDLDDTALDILIATIAPHLDPEVPALFRKLRGGMWSEHVDAALLVKLFATDWNSSLGIQRALGPQSPLLRNRLVRVVELPGAASALQTAVAIHPRILQFVLGEEGLHHLIAPFCEIEHPAETLEQVVLPQLLIDHVLELIEPHADLEPRLSEWGYDRVLGYGRGTVLLFVGAPGTGKTLLSRAIANHLGRPLLRVYVSKMTRSTDGPEDVLEELGIEARLRRAALLFDDCAALFAEGGTALSALLAFLERFEGVAVLATNHSEHLDLALERRVLLRVDFPRPDAVARERIFEALLPAEVPIATGTDIQQLAATYDFTGGTIKNTVMVALNKAIARDPVSPQLDQGLLRDAAEHQLRYRLDDFAVVAEGRLGLDDVVLRDDIRAKVIELLEACRNHRFLMSQWGFGARLVTGKGIVALFDGPPGTGKTLCAEVLGRELGLPVSRINIPSIVSKWVGETEQHLAELFRRARAGRSILLFDEADALFGKRVASTEKATDRYANMEVNYLLQEIERYDGVVILTTNLAGAMDDAVQRRILFRITFPEPDAELRAQIWQTLIPASTPLDPDIKWAELGDRFDFPGGRIKNAVLRAAYRARQSGAAALAMEHLVAAGIDEAKAAGKVVRVG